ncbi:DNA-directed RNA polymerase III subunit RPC4 [Conger conger]|uniref:DNA-directed RNA polymerase III subunit RPC4 n=1 Tax=Conger conger TaxID=82655 RepID=UPI002A5A751A|nr:DNA-directed RNA polymerase III subunit RPC4 [Conger conger]
MSDQHDSDNAGSTPGTSDSRQCFALGRSLPGRVSLNPQPPPGRLSSLRSRDLTLGGFKKKTFIPNVHSVRKSKDELKEDVHSAPKREKKEKEEKHREVRGRRKERPQTIQSHSIFEQGPADTIRKSGSWDSTEQNEYGHSPVLKCIKKEKHVAEDDENEILQKLQRDDFLDDPGLKNDARNRPIQLPLYQSSNFFTGDAAVHVKEETAGDGTSSAVPRVQTQRCSRLTKGFPKPQQPAVAELFQQLAVSEREELFFIQLPDSLPGQPESHTEKPPKKDTKSDDKRQSHIKTREPVGKESAPVLSDFSEGSIGKLQIRKSGRVQLALGEIVMDVSEGAAFSFLQQLVSVRLSEGLAGDMSILGNVKHKLVCSPDFEALLQEVKLPPNTRSGNS